MKHLYRLLSLSLLIILLTACAAPTVAPTSAPTLAPAPTTAPTAVSTAAPTADALLYLDASKTPAERAADLLARMTLAEKIGQMTQVEKNSITPEGVREALVGSVLSGGGGYPSTGNTPSEWLKMVNNYQKAALQTRLKIPMIYGVDAVHGHNNLSGATIFPHNIGLGATGDAALVEQIGRATAEEVAATGIRWNFAPVVAVVQDIRWGRTYEGYSENTDLVTKLGTAYIQGLQGKDLTAADSVLADPKHYIGDGGTAWGSATTNNYKIDQGVTQADEATLRKLYLPPYQAAIQAGSKIVMVSFSSWDGKRMSAQKYLVTDVLKDELKFDGFVVSDWGSIDMISPDYYQAVVTAINAGLDMNMVPYDYKKFETVLAQAVEKGDVPLARIDDAVTRILKVKFAMGLFERPVVGEDALAQVGSAAHRALARKAVAESLVLLKNDNEALPLKKDAIILVAGKNADDIGADCGGWTIEWQGKPGPLAGGTSILEGIRAATPGEGQVLYDRYGKFDKLVDAAGKPRRSPVGIVVVGESPYAEGVGDAENLALERGYITAINNLRERVDRLIVVVVSGRPLVITEQLPQIDALVAAWLPGTEGAGVADVLFGDQPFTGKLPYSWPRDMGQLPFDFAHPGEGCDAPLFPFGYGLAYGEASPVAAAVCP